jgi:hypothetical protein
VTQSKGWESEFECLYLSHQKAILNSERFTAILVEIGLESNLSSKILGALEPHGAEAALTSRLSLIAPTSMCGQISNHHDNRLMNS